MSKFWKDVIGYGAAATYVSYTGFSNPELGYTDQQAYLLSLPYGYIGGLSVPIIQGLLEKHTGAGPFHQTMLGIIAGGLFAGDAAKPIENSLRSYFDTMNQKVQTAPHRAVSGAFQMNIPETLASRPACIAFPGARLAAGVNRPSPAFAQ